MPTSTVSAAKKRRSAMRRGGAWQKLVKGLLVSVAVTLIGILVFALLMQWLRPSDTAIRVFNQVLKLASILAGCHVMLKAPGEKALLLGAGLGLLYMGLGCCLFAILSGQALPLRAYLADLAMGVAGGGIGGAIIGGLRK